MLHPAWYLSVIADSLPPILLVVAIVALMEDDTTVILVGQDMGRDAIQKPAIM